LLSWLPGYQRIWLYPDLIALLAIVTVLIPESIVFAELAEMQLVLTPSGDFREDLTPTHFAMI
jgi:MFS superfamily sulfate permease-like transporter